METKNISRNREQQLLSTYQSQSLQNFGPAPELQSGEQSAKLFCCPTLVPEKDMLGMNFFSVTWK